MMAQIARLSSTGGLFTSRGYIDMAGRPSSFSQDKADLICESLLVGDSLRTACDEHGIEIRTVMRWLRDNEEFRQQYARAKDDGCFYLFEEMQDIADDGRNDWMEQYDSDGEVTGYKVNGEAIQRSKLRIDTRKWALSKLLPKKYGEKQQLDLSSEDGSMSPNRELTDEEVQQELKRRGLPQDVLSQ